MLTRIITGVIGIAAATFIIQTGGTVFAAFALLLPLVAYFEYTRAFQNVGKDPMFLLGVVSIVLLWLCGFLGMTEYLPLAVTAIVLVILLMTVLLYGHVHFIDAALTVTGIFYFALPFLHMFLLRGLFPETIVATPLDGLLPVGFSFGCAMIWVMFLCTWASDTFAYFVGSAIGSHKLAPAISPNKTIEGFLGSLVGTTAVGAGLGFFFSLPVTEMAVLGFALAIVATLGDLVESVAKRETRIKDSGSIIPGHGGVWDRFDSCLLTAPVVYYFVQFSGIALK